MTMTGDHGGDSSDELNSALFVYSKENFTEFNQSNIQTIYQVYFLYSYFIIFLI